MLLDDVLSGLTTKTAFVLLAVVLVLSLVKNHYNHGLNKYPAPFPASFTDLWRFFSVMRGKPQITLRQLHEQHGDVVRVGPNSLSFSNPEAIKTIYSITHKLIKSGFYPVQMQVSRGEVLQSLFGTQDEDYHTRLRRTVSNAFSMTSLIQYEPRVDETVRVFLEQTDKLYAAPGKVCNFILWLQYFAFDVVTEITYSRRVGFVDNCEDVDGIIAWLSKIFDYQAPVGQMPWLDKLFVKNPIRTLLSKYGFIDNSSGTAKFSRARMAERLREMADKKAAGKDEMATDSMDLLNMFLKAQRQDPTFFNDSRLLTMTTSIALAGSDTTAIGLAAVFYNLLKNPSCYHKLNEELDNAVQTGLIANEGGLVTWTDAQKLPYLHACIQETFRMHPSIGLILERITPPQGLDICGQFIPGGTIVGCNSWVLHYRREVFGDDVDVYRPERWLLDPTSPTDSLRLKEMNNVLFHFGGGTRTCLGKNIALLEMYKLIPSLLRRFEIQLTTDEDWDLHNAWFVKPKKFDVKLVSKKRT